MMKEWNAYVSPVSVSPIYLSYFSKEEEKKFLNLFNNKGVYSIDLTTEYPRLEAYKLEKWEYSIYCF